MLSVKKNAPVSQSDSFSAPTGRECKTPAERVAEFMRETDSISGSAPNKADSSTAKRLVNDAPKQKSKQERSWWASLPGGDKD